MKIQYCSDLHLEFLENRNFLEQHPIVPVGEILLLAGDILPFSLHKKSFEFINFIADNFESVYWIPGNHEYYHFDMATVAPPLLEKLRSNVFLINDKVIIYKDVKIICSTLWSKIRAEHEFAVEQNVSDFQFIKINGKPLLAQDFNRLHDTDLSFLKNAVKKNSDHKTIVMTHHVPTLRNYPPKYKESILNDAFVTDLTDFISANNVPYWIYGHHHYNTPDFKIGKTTLLTNQLGYVHLGEHKGFKDKAMIEV